MANITAELREGTVVTLHARQFTWKGDEPLVPAGPTNCQRIDPYMEPLPLDLSLLCDWRRGIVKRRNTFRGWDSRVAGDQANDLPKGQRRRRHTRCSMPRTGGSGHRRLLQCRRKRGA